MIAVNWGEAWQIGGDGFGLVFIILIILAVVIWLTGLVLNRISPTEHKTEQNKKET